MLLLKALIRNSYCVVHLEKEVVIYGKYVLGEI